MRKPIIRELLKERDIIVGGCQQILDPLVTECIAQSGVDFVFMDLEHTGRSIDALQCCFLAAAAANVATLVRVRDISYFEFSPWVNQEFYCVFHRDSAI